MDRLSLALLLVPVLHVGLRGWCWLLLDRKQLGGGWWTLALMLLSLVVVVGATLLLPPQTVLLLAGLYPLVALVAWVCGQVIALHRWARPLAFVALYGYTLGVLRLLYPAIAAAEHGGALWLRYTVSDAMMRMLVLMPSAATVEVAGKVDALMVLVGNNLEVALAAVLWWATPTLVPAAGTLAQSLRRTDWPPVAWIGALAAVGAVAGLRQAVLVAAVLLFAGGVLALMQLASWLSVALGRTMLVLVIAMLFLQWPVPTMMLLALVGLLDQAVSLRALTRVLDRLRYQRLA